MIDFTLAEETLGYQTDTDPSNTDHRLLVAGSQNVLLDVQKKVRSRPGYTRLGVSGTLGPELITNGTFVSDVSGWTLNLFGSNGTFVWSSAGGLVTGGNLGLQFQQIGSALNASFQYLLTFDLSITTAGDASVNMIDSAGTQVDEVLGTQDYSLPRSGHYSFTVDPSLLTSGIDVSGVLFGFDAGFVGTVQNISLRKIITTNYPILNGWTWDTSTGHKLPQRNYNGILEVYLGTVDTVAINAWTQVSAIFSTTKKLRPALSLITSGGGIYDPVENIDVQVMANGDTNLYEWGGGVAVVGSIPDGTHVIKAGTSTWAQNRFYSARNMTMVCVRTGTVYTYSAGMSGLNLTVSSSTGLVAGDILVQSIVTNSNKPNSVHVNDIVFPFLNQIVSGSASDDLVFISKNSAATLTYTDFAYSSPRVAGEGGLLTLDGPTRAINALGTYLLIFSGLSTIFRGNYQQITVSTTLAETLNMQKFDVGVRQGALQHEAVVAIGNQLAYLTNEVALRTITNVANLTGIDPKRLSNPIKPDFDAGTWTDAFGIWYKNVLLFSDAAAGKTFMLNFTEDASGRVQRFWNPPQLLPVGAFSVIDSGNGPLLHGHSYSVPETYLLFDGLSDGQYANMDPGDKIAINAIAKFAYSHYGHREQLKNFDEYAVDGEINTNTTDLQMELDYDFDGYTQALDKTIDGSDEDILQGVIQNNSLAQSLLAMQPLGGLLTPPADARRFHVIFEMAKEDFFELSATFQTNDVDRYWGILAHGPNAQISRRKPTHIKK